MANLWTRFDPLSGDIPCHLEGAENCFYARERVVGAGYDRSQANNLISNFKIKPSVREENPRRWYWKEKAASQFAAELAGLLPQAFAVAPVPQSKARDDVRFDPRFDMVFERLGRLRPDLKFCEPIIRSESVEASHETGRHPSLDEILETFEYEGFGDDDPPEAIVFIDDVVTRGTHYSACRRLVHRNKPGCEVFGAFWAMSVWEANGAEDVEG